MKYNTKKVTNYSSLFQNHTGDKQTRIWCCQGGTNSLHNITNHFSNSISNLKITAGKCWHNSGGL